MGNQEFEFITYSKEQSIIVESGIKTIREVFSTSSACKRSLLFCFDKYLDPYYGYELSYFDEIIILLQEYLIKNEDIKVKKDILNLLSLYSKNELDYLADKIDLIEPELLAETLYTLNMTYNPKYISIISKYENHQSENVRNVVKVALSDLLKVQNN